MDFQRQEWHWHHNQLLSRLSGFIPDLKTFNSTTRTIGDDLQGFVTLIEIASLEVVCWNDRRKISFF